MKKILAVFAVILIAVIAGCVGFYTISVKPQENYEAAEKALKDGDYKEALDKYKAAKDYEDAKVKAEAIENYNDAVELMSQGKLKKAHKKLKKVNEEAEVINCDYLKMQCKTFKKFNFTKKATGEREREKDSKFDQFGYYGSVQSTDLYIHVKTTIDEDGTVHIGAYTDTNKKENEDSYNECSYERNSKNIEWTEDDPSNDEYSIGYSYSTTDKVLKISGFTKKDGRMDYSRQIFFGSFAGLLN